MPDLRNSKLKVERAGEHLADLYRELTVYCASTPVRLIKEESPASDLYIIRFLIEEPSWKTALIVGDFAYCLRSALDQLAWQLVLTNTKKRPGRSTCFPIHEKVGKSFASAVEGVPIKAIEIIESLQPYKLGSQHRDSILWKLNQLCNLDKHQRIAVHGHATTIQFPAFPRRLSNLLRFDADRGIVTAPLAMKELLQHEPNARFDLVFGDTNIDFTVRVDDLKQMHKAVGEEVIPKFECFFSPDSV